MHCPNCDADNKPERKFCGECGSALNIVCAKCFFENDPDDQFCGGCGSSLAPVDDIPETTENVQTVSVSGDAERRQLTIMFCDLVGSTSLSEEMDPEDLSRVISSFQDACTGAINRYQGYVARLMGDGMLVYFGYPTAHEDDPERAVRAGLDILKALPDVQAGRILSVRIGIATGLVVVGDLIGEASSEERAVFGETPNLAARLQALADPDTIVIAPSTKAMLGGNFAFQDLGTHKLKGLSNPVRAYRVDALLQTESRFEAYRGDSATPLVGRKEELAFIHEKWSLAKSGEGQSVTLSGEAGIGKSRILGAVRARIDEDGARSLHFQCSPYHQTTVLYPFVDFLNRSIGSGHNGNVLDDLEALLEQAGNGVNETAGLIADLLLIPTNNRYPATENDPQKQRSATLGAIINLVFGLAKKGPLLVVFEDAHWIDPTSLELLSMMMDRAQSCSMLILVTYRPELNSPWDAMGHVAKLMVNRISRHQCAEIVASIAENKDIPQSVLKHILAKTDGVPLYVEEMTKAIVSSTGDGLATAIPATLQDSLMARLDQLGTAKEIAQIGALIGREFSRNLLQAITDRSDAELQLELESLIKAELIFRRGWPPNEAFVFKHALVQDTAYESLLKDKRRSLHEAVASVLESHFPERTLAEPEILALHLSACEEDARASIYWEKAGRRAQEQWSHSEAATHFEQALDGVGDDRAREFDLCLLLVASQRVLGRSGDTKKSLERAEPLARNDRDKAQVFSQFGNLFFLSGESDKALDAHQKFLDVSRQSEMPEFECQALSGLADVHYLRGHMISARKQSEECVATARRHGLDDVVASNLPSLGNMTYLSQGPTAARQIHEDGALEVVKTGQPRAEMIIRYNYALILLDGLAFDEALKQAEMSLAECKRIDAMVWIPLIAQGELRVRHTMGENVEAGMKDLARQAVEISPALSGPWVLGGLAQVTSDLDTAINAMNQALEIIDTGCVAHNQLWFYRDAIDCCLRFGLWDKATEHAAALDEFTASEPLAWNRYFVSRGRALTDHGRGQGSRDELQQVADVGNELGFLHSLQAIEIALNA